MDFSQYQRKTEETAIYPRKGNQGIIYCALGLTGEAGEVAEKVKKVLRDENGVFTEEKRREIAKEVGDVLWYCSQISYELGFPLESVAWNNLEKLQDRKTKGMLKGNGDNR